MYEVVNVPHDAAEAPEQIGSKYKFWFRTPDRSRWLFKQGRPGTGEDWAEKVACEVCALLGIPHARYELARWRDRDGVVSKSIVPVGGRLVLGNELLVRLRRDYDPERSRRTRQHTLRLVLAVVGLEGVNPPSLPRSESEIRNSADVFVGYLMLDALIGNTDRHHENWALVVNPNRIVELAPTFDHASSLGRNESDERRQARLETRDRRQDVRRYSERALSALYRTPSDSKPMGTFEAFREGGQLRPSAALVWLNQLAKTDRVDYERILEQVPRTPKRITEPAARFALEMLTINRERLLELRSELEG
ncbi:MAG: hypothetical protein KC466_10275 [Myxococcales bacterium]|nr:hypothetical protein [Myxococcales bacterium]